MITSEIHGVQVKRAAGEGALENVGKDDPNIVAVKTMP